MRLGVRLGCIVVTCTLPFLGLQGQISKQGLISMVWSKSSNSATIYHWGYNMTLSRSNEAVFNHTHPQFGLTLKKRGWRLKLNNLKKFMLEDISLDTMSE